MSNVVIFSIVKDLDNAYITFYVPGDTKTIDSSHPNFALAEDYCANVLNGLTGPPTTDQVEDWIDIPKAVKRRFSKLSERVSVSANGEVMLDGDPVDNLLTQQILDFMDNGLDFEPLVRFYEKLLTNPLGDVREELFGWVKRQGNLTITAEGDLIGYKSLYTCDGGFRPSRADNGGVVNGVEVPAGQYLVQNVGDVVEMPRSQVTHDFSRACAHGLHVGTSAYAFGFSGDAKFAVHFSPRDVVSIGDNSAGKLRVCRYTVVQRIEDEQPITGGLYASLNDALGAIEDEVEAISDALNAINDAEDVLDDDLFVEDTDLDVSLDDESAYSNVPDFAAGDRVIDDEGDEGTVVRAEGGTLEVEYDESAYSNVPVSEAVRDLGLTRTHGKGGPTSQSAKGRGRNPAQDNLGRFSAGRPGSRRDSSTGRFA